MRGRRARWALLAVLVVLGLILIAGGTMVFTTTPEEPPATASVDQIGLGQELYAEYCSSCHGVELQGQPDWQTRRADGTLPAPPHDETGHTWHHPDQQLFAITKLGTAALVGPDYKTDMRGFGDVLNDAEIRAILAYIKSRWPEEIRRRQAEVTERAAASE
jgi:mono/diheme cytochrome c family protein